MRTVGKLSVAKNGLGNRLLSAQTMDRGLKECLLGQNSIGNTALPGSILKRAVIQSATTFKHRGLRSRKSGCCPLRSREHGWLKYEWLGSTKRGQSVPPSGLFTAKSAIGNLTSQKPRTATTTTTGNNNNNNNNNQNNNNNNNNNNSNKMSSVLFMLLLSCSLFTFAASFNDIPIFSFNLHGFKSSSAYLKSSVAKHGGIWLCQELWLSEQQLPQLNQINAQFVARSGMEEAISDRIYSGRPFGGVCIAWSSKFNNSISPLSNIRHKRVVGVELKTTDDDFLILCAYLPFFDASNRTRCMSETVDVITMIENIIDNHPSHKIILGGDFNTEFKGESPFDPLWNEFVSKFQLACCDGKFSPDTITYRHDTLNQEKWNDHFLVSE